MSGVLGIRSDSTEFSEVCQNSANSDSESTLESLWCIRIPACWDTHDITSEWVICQS
jgi:hypothetical protein